MMLRRGSTLAYASLRRATLATSSGASTGVAVGHSGHLSAEEPARRSELRNVHDGPAVETHLPWLSEIPDENLKLAMQGIKQVINRNTFQ